MSNSTCYSSRHGAADLMERSRWGANFINEMIAYASSQRSGECAVEGFTLLLDMFASQESLVDVKDFASDLQAAVFQSSPAHGEALRRYVADVRGRRRARS